MCRLNLAFSPCPNDTFMFEAMINGRIDTKNYQFNFVLEDIETLNQAAFDSKYDITKISFHAYLYTNKNYILLNTGNAMGENVGPLLVSKTPYTLSDIYDLSIVAPGKYTTANLLLKILFPAIKEPENTTFCNIEQSLLNNEYQAGILIHENRFLYQEHGLSLIADLGTLWTSKYNTLVPLGGIVANRKLPYNVIEDFQQLLRESIEYAIQHPEKSMEFVKSQSQSLDDETIKKHINTYVNDYSKTLNAKGLNTINNLFDIACINQLIEPLTKKIIF